MNKKLFCAGILISMLAGITSFGQKKETKTEDKKEDKISSSTVSAFKWRSIGPALTSGRIADFAVNPDNISEYYVAVASGHIWKTTNAGTTFDPVFDNYGSYSIGCLAMDPKNSHVVWAGTGENNHQRALGYGDGVYKTVDGGKQWKNMGLKEARQIGMILIDPRNTDVVYVAAEGSAWGPGSERGLYKTTDGGTTWKKVLHVSDNTGINNVICDPRNPDVLYATSEQRRRHVFTKIGGGPESTVYKSTDAGANWRKIDNGLPAADKGGMGIAISPVNPDIIYLIVEAANDESGFYRSSDRGESWTKMSNHASSGQYYNEIYCDPLDVNKVYSVETVSHVTSDGGKTWDRLGLKGRHVDDHALWINPKNTSHFFIGGDGGVYETFDAGTTYKYFTNLPVTQFYRVYLDNDYPFYNVYGGTQDNNSLGGPSQNRSSSGVSNYEWFATLGGDGFWGMVDPSNPDIVYSEYQYGNAYRYDKKSGELLYIKPQPSENEDTYKWNWDAPLIISAHANSRIYIAANKLFRSDDRGNTWKTISPDLTTQTDRNTWPVMDKYWSSDAVAKDISTSPFGTIVSLAESPVNENLLFVGTDDGLIQITDDAGKTWSKISSFPGLPAYTYVSDIFASQFDENVVYATFNNHKRDDFKPYVFKSTDKGKTWKSISNNLPANGMVHTLSQDFKDQDLLFAGTEFGIFFSYNGGQNWAQLKSGIPTIAVRDIALQKRETAIVVATFGRGFYVIDNYAPLREVKESLLDKPAHLFDIKDALIYIQTDGRYGQGATYYLSKNPDFGATFTYYIKEVPKTAKDERLEKEKELFKEGKPIPQLSPEQLDNEAKEEKSFLMFTITDAQGNVVRKITTKASKGINTIVWDLRTQGINPYSNVDSYNPTAETRAGVLVMPGKYQVNLAIFEKGVYKDLNVSKTFTVKPIDNGSTLPAADATEILAFQQIVSNLVRDTEGALRFTKEMKGKVAAIRQTLVGLPNATPALLTKAAVLAKEIDAILLQMEGVEVKASYEELPPHKLPVYQRIDYVMYTHYSSTSGITQTERDQFEILKKTVNPIIDKIRKLATDDLAAIEKELDALKAPWTPGRLPSVK